MELKSNACDAQTLGILHMDVHCQDLGFLYLMYSPKIQAPTNMLLGTYYYGLTILVVAQGVCGTEKILIIERMHHTWIRIFADVFV